MAETKIKTPKKSKSYLKQRVNQGTWFCMPAILLTAAMVVAPLIYVVYLSFHSWNGAFNKTPEFVGFEKYATLPDTVGFADMLKFTLFFAIVVTFLVVGISLVVAFALDKPKGKHVNRSLLRACWYVPALIGGTAVGIVWRIMYNYNNGIMNELMKMMGLQPVNWLETIGVTNWAVIVAQVWVMMGMCIIIFLADLQSIPEELYEAATIDGATAMQQRMKIAIPMLAPSITINFITTSISAFKAYELPYTISKGLPGYTTHLVTQMIRQYTFESMDYGRGAALSVLLLLIIFAIQLIQLVVLQKREEVYD